jgi:hypothetical protein
LGLLAWEQRIVSTDSVDPSPSFVRRYRLPITLGVLVLVASIVGLRLTLNYLAEQPIVDPFKSYIEQLADVSPEARSELQRYRATSGRDSVASQDFLPLCKTMLRQALAQAERGEVQVAQISSGKFFVLCK